MYHRPNACTLQPTTFNISESIGRKWTNIFSTERAKSSMSYGTGLGPVAQEWIRVVCRSSHHDIFRRAVVWITICPARGLATGTLWIGAVTLSMLAQTRIQNSNLAIDYSARSSVDSDVVKRVLAVRSAVPQRDIELGKRHKVPACPVPPHRPVSLRRARRSTGLGACHMVLCRATRETIWFLTHV